MKNYISLDDAREAMWRVLNGMGYDLKNNDSLREEVDAVLESYSTGEEQDAKTADCESLKEGK